MRSRKDAQRQFVNADQLKTCQKDPGQAWTIAGPDVIVCLECGVKLEQLGHHVNSKHDMTAAKYKRQPGLGSQAPRYSLRRSLLSTNLRDSRSKQAKSMRIADQLEGHRPSAQRLFQSRGPWKGSLEYRLNKKEAMKGKAWPKLWKRTPEGRVATDASIAKLRLEGMTREEIGQHFGMKKGNGRTIGMRLHRMGFPPGYPCLFEYGKPVTGRYIRDLCSDFGMTRKEMAEKIPVHKSTLGKKASSDEPLPIQFAERALEVRKELAKQYRHKGATPEGGRPPLILPSQRISICASYKELVHDLKILQKWLKQQDKDVSRSGVWTWLCERSRDRTIRLLFWPEFIDRFTSDSCTAIAYATPKDLAEDFLVGEYKVAVETIRRNLKRGSPKQQAMKRPLEDMLTIFAGAKAMSSKDLAKALEESGHASWKNCTKIELAQKLKLVGVKPKVIRLPGNKTPRGYKRKDIQRALRNILPLK